MEIIIMTDGRISPFYMDALESRTLLSAAPVSLATPPHANAGATVMPLGASLAPLATTLANIAGKYSGSVTVTGVHTQPVKVTLKQGSNGKLTGTLTTPQDPSIKVKITGKVTSRKAFSFTLSNGTHPGGAIAGSGTGAIKGTSLTIKMNFVQGGTSTPGRITLKKL
jgi:hypothetical protein